MNALSFQLNCSQALANISKNCEKAYCRLHPPTMVFVDAEANILNIRKECFLYCKSR